MLAAPGLSSYGFTYDNWGADPGLNPGTSVVPGASSVEGSWTNVASSANIAQDCYWIVIKVIFGATTAAIKNHLLDIGIDNAGGTSYTAVVNNIVCGESPAFNSTVSGPRDFLIPLLIKAGSSVAVRVQGSNATAGTVRIAVKFYGQPSNPENVPVGQYSETVGSISSSAGVSFTPGNLADGAWASLGTSTVDMWWWQLGVQCTNATILGLLMFVDLAYGDATNKVIIQRQMIYTGTAEVVTDVFRSNLVWMDAYRPVPAGSTFYVRGRASGAPETGWNACVTGIGG